MARSIRTRNPSADRALSTNWRFWLAIAWGLILALAGGASRSDDPHQLMVRLIAVLVLVAALWRPETQRLSQYRPILIFTAIAAAVLMIQLIPLPFSLWRLLPGRETYARFAQATGTAGGWRAISLTPDLTWNALLSALPPLATAVAVISLHSAQRHRLATALLVLVLASGALGLLQVAAGPTSSLRFYTVTNAQNAVGIFANRNHHTMILSIGIILIGLGWDEWRARPRARAIVSWLAAGAVAYMILCALASGSRAGLLGCIVAIPLAVAVRGRPPRVPTRPSDRPTRPLARRQRITQAALVAAPAVALALVVVAAVAFGRASAVQRLFATSVDAESRIAWLPGLLRMARAFFPVGSGFGSFDPVYRRFETFDTLSISYANQAHNDLLQLVIEGGLPGIALLAILAWWWVRRGIAVWTRSDGWDDTTRRYARAGAAISALLLAFSLSDYPLRTPMLASVFVLAIVWMVPGRARPPAAA